MKLLTKELRDRLPAIGSTDGQRDPVAQVKFFTPDTQWTWYATEFDGEDLFFGLVDGLEKELGYFSLSELESVRGPLGLPIERDLYFDPTPLSALHPILFPLEVEHAEEKLEEVQVPKREPSRDR